VGDPRAERSVSALPGWVGEMEDVKVRDVKNSVR
jgi:hypothetical protein